MGQNNARASLPHSEVDSEDPEVLEKYQARRTKIVTEIVETEKSYVQSMQMLYDKWEKPLREAIKSGKEILSEADIKTIFSISQGLLCLHELMWKALALRLEQWSKEQIIGDIFLQNGNALKLYAEYVNQYNNGVVLINKRQKEKAFSHFLKENGGLMNLSSLLIQPVQRIPRYQMLLTDLVKFTWTSHNDYTRLLTALGMIIEAATFVNEQKRRAECLERLLEIQTSLNQLNKLTKYTFYEAHRTIVSEGEIDKQKSGGKKPHRINYCLMSDKLIFWDKKRGKVYLLGDLKDMNAVCNQQEISITIYYLEKDNISIEFDSEQLREKWFSLFKEAQHNERPVDAQGITEEEVSHQFALRQVSPRGGTHSNNGTIRKLRNTESFSVLEGSLPPERVPLPESISAKSSLNLSDSEEAPRRPPRPSFMETSEDSDITKLADSQNPQSTLSTSLVPPPSDAPPQPAPPASLPPPIPQATPPASLPPPIPQASPPPTDIAPSPTTPHDSHSSHHTETSSTHRHSHEVSTREEGLAPKPSMLIPLPGLTILPQDDDSLLKPSQVKAKLEIKMKEDMNKKEEYNKKEPKQATEPKGKDVKLTEEDLFHGVGRETKQVKAKEGEEVDMRKESKGKEIKQQPRREDYSSHRSEPSNPITNPPTQQKTNAYSATTTPRSKENTPLIKEEKKGPCPCCTVM